MMLYLTLVLCLFHWTNGEDVDSRRGRRDIDAPPSTPDWLASLVKNGEYVCAGALIHPDWVLASARCVDSGITFVNPNNCGKGKGGNCKLRVANIIKHPMWDGAMQDDVALIQLRDSAPAGNTMNVANRNRDRKIQAMAKQECYQLDWINGGKDADHIPAGLMADLECDRWSPSYTIHDPLCGVSEAKGACQRDIGTPIVCKDGKNMYLVGFAVDAEKERSLCVTVLTRASRYHAWIRATKMSVDKTNVRTGDRCVPMSVSACADRNAVCTPGPYSFRCLCTAGLELIDGECTMPAALGAACSLSFAQPCADENALCQDTCQCMERYTNNGTACDKILGLLREVCSIEWPCNEMMDCTPVNGTSTCACKYNHVETSGRYCQWDG